MTKTKVLVNGLWVEKPVKFGAPTWRTKVTTPPPPANPIPAAGIRKANTNQQTGVGTGWNYIRGMRYDTSNLDADLGYELRIPAGYDDTMMVCKALATVRQGSTTGRAPWRVYIHNGSTWDVPLSVPSRTSATAQEETFQYLFKSGYRVYLSYQAWSGGNTTVDVADPNYFRITPL